MPNDNSSPKSRKLIGIIQSNYIPWRGYFDFIQQVDEFVVFDDTQYTMRDWRNRNKIKTDHGLRWLTVPVLARHQHLERIEQTPINYSLDWISDHKKWLSLAYSKAPHFESLAPQFFALLEKKPETISELNISIIKWVMEYLKITTPLRFSSEFQAEGKKTDRLLEIVLKAKATDYLSGPTAKGYLEEEKFTNQGIGLYYKTYDYPEYPQLWGAFDGAVSILDLLFNCGDQSPDYIRSRSPNQNCNETLPYKISSPENSVIA